MSVDLDAIHAELPQPTRTVRLVVSDMDGTILTPDKKLTPAVRAAVKDLTNAGIGLCLASARPPARMLPYVEQLGLTSACAGFNGGSIFTPDGARSIDRILPPDAVAAICDVLEVHGVETWILRGDEWLVREIGSPFVEKERRASGHTPTPVGDFHGFYEGVNKVMGVGNNYSLLERLETEIDAMLGDVVSARRSHEDLLDVTPSLANKGEALRELAALYGVAPEEVASIGDSFNDQPMFEAAGLGIAMGQAPEAVQAGAHYVTDTNEQDGWARAVAQYILPRAPKAGDHTA